MSIVSMGSNENRLNGTLSEGVHKLFKTAFGKQKLLKAINQKTFRISGIEADAKMSYFHYRYSAESLYAIA